MNCVRACSRSSRILRQISPSVTGIALTWTSATRTCRLWKRSNALTLCSAVSSTHCLPSIAMSDTTGSPRKPSVTAIALSKKNLPGFSQERCETDRHGESKPPPDDSAETYLRSVLGIGLQVSDTHTDGTELAETLPRGSNASAEDPAIVEWGLRAEAPVSATKAVHMIVFRANCDERELIRMSTSFCFRKTVHAEVKMPRTQLWLTCLPGNREGKAARKGGLMLLRQRITKPMTVQQHFQRRVLSRMWKVA